MNTAVQENCLYGYDMKDYVQLKFIIAIATFHYVEKVYSKRCQWKTKQIWGIWKLPPAYSPKTPNLGQNRWCFVPCDLEIWWITLENNRASLLCCFKLCATFHSHRWIQTGVTVRNAKFGSNSTIFFICMTLKFDRWLCKTIGHLFDATSSFVRHFVAIGELKLELQSGNAQFGSNSTIYRLDWIGLDLFNDDTRSSGLISCPSQVGFSHRCLHSKNEF